MGLRSQRAPTAHVGSSPIASGLPLRPSGFALRSRADFRCRCRGHLARARGPRRGRRCVVHPRIQTGSASAEATTATIRPSFSPDKLGAKAAFTFAAHFAGGELGVPSPVRRAVVHFPPGLTLDVPKLTSCTKARLQAHGARGCPAQSQIGTGRALADVHVGSTVESEEAAVSAFVGPPQGLNPTIEILGQGYSPLEERVVITATALPDNPPYGEKLVMSVPAIPTIPLEPNASTVSFSVTIGGKAAKEAPQPQHGPAALPLSRRRLPVRRRIHLRRRLHQHQHRDGSLPVAARQLPMVCTLSAMEAILSILQVIIAVVLIFLVLMHSGKDAGLSGAFGVGTGQGPLGGGSLVERNLNRWTVFFAILFVGNTIILLKKPW